MIWPCGPQLCGGSRDGGLRVPGCGSSGTPGFSRSFPSSLCVVETSSRVSEVYSGFIVEPAAAEQETLQRRSTDCPLRTNSAVSSE